MLGPQVKTVQLVRCHTSRPMFSCTPAVSLCNPLITIAVCPYHRYACVSEYWGDGMDDQERQLAQKLLRMEQAYSELATGSETLLQLDTVYWTEKLLLKIVRSLYRHRLDQISDITKHIPDELT